MKRLSMMAAIAVGLLAAPGLARAQITLPSLPPNPNITVDYVMPVDPIRQDYDLNDPLLSDSDRDDVKKLVSKFEAFKGVRERMMKSLLLERFRLFLTAVKLPTTYRLRAKQCDEVNAFFTYTDDSLNICYEYVLSFEQRAKKNPIKGITEQEAVIGSVISTMLHETGHALFSMFRVPILGKEEDAADLIAGFVMLQFGTDVARTTIKGAAWKWASQDWSDPAYYDVHSSPQARFYNFLCIAYGGNPAAFQEFIDKNWLPASRVPNCKQEYHQAEIAFTKTIGPHLDQDLLKRVQQTKWLSDAELGLTPTTAPSNTTTTGNGGGDQGQQPAKK